MSVTWKKIAFADDVVLKTFMAAKGDLIGASANDTPLILTVGANDTVLMAASGQTTGLKWATIAEQQAAIFGAVLPENVAIILDAALSADEKYSGIVEAGVAGTTLNFGDCVYLAVADSRWELAKADADATATMKLGINVTVAQVADGDAMTVLLLGKVRSDADYALTIGAPVYLSAATAGDVTPTAPGTGKIVRIVGYGNTADELYFCPENDWITLV